MSTFNQKSIKILIAPLDWGLGHATRVIPLIHDLINAGCEVVIASGGPQALILEKEFPQLEIRSLSGYGIRYAEKGWFFPIKMMLQLPKIIRAIRKERKQIEGWLKTEHFDAIISDNRYGCYHPKTYNVFITHQIQILSGFGSLADSILLGLHRRQISRFHACWVPDFAGNPNLSGRLGHPKQLPANTHYLGPLSRLQAPSSTSPKYDLLVLLSGPEPSRSILENSLLTQIQTQTKLRTLLVRGTPQSKKVSRQQEHIDIVSHLDSRALAEAICSSALVICRSGYSSVMDLAQLQQKAILIPTPGQTEQSYLANYLEQAGYFLQAPQAHFDLSNILKKAAQFPYKTFPLSEATSVRKVIIQRFLQTLQERRN